MAFSVTGSPTSIDAVAGDIFNEVSLVSDAGSLQPMKFKHTSNNEHKNVLPNLTILASATF